MDPEILDDTETTTVDEQLFNDCNDKRNNINQLHLNKLKAKTNIIYTLVAILATALSSIYSYFAFKLARDGYDISFDKFSKDTTQTLQLRWISCTIFTVGQIFMSLLMMCLLKVRFYYFYEEYGCFLWTVVAIQAFSLLI